MATKAPSNPNIQAPTSSDPRGLSSYLSQVMNRVSDFLYRNATRANLCLSADGTEAMTGPLSLAQYTTVNLPTASSYGGSLVFDSTENTLKYSNGSSWIDLAAGYSQGTWTPTLQGNSTAGSATYTQQVGTYEQIGRLVVARFRIRTSAFTGAVGTIQVSGLPFTSGSDSSINTMGGPVSAANAITIDAGYSFLALVVEPSSKIIDLQEIGSNITSQGVPVANWAAASTATLFGNVIYHT